MKLRGWQGRSDSGRYSSGISPVIRRSGSGGARVLAAANAGRFPASRSHRASDRGGSGRGGASSAITRPTECALLIVAFTFTTRACRNGRGHVLAAANACRMAKRRGASVTGSHNAAMRRKPARHDLPPPWSRSFRGRTRHGFCLPDQPCTMWEECRSVPVRAWGRTQSGARSLLRLPADGRAMRRQGLLKRRAGLADVRTCGASYHEQRSGSDRPSCRAPGRGGRCA